MFLTEYKGIYLHKYLHFYMSFDLQIFHYHPIYLHFNKYLFTCVNFLNFMFNKIKTIGKFFNNELSRDIIKKAIQKNKESINKTVLDEYIKIAKKDF